MWKRAYYYSSFIMKSTHIHTIIYRNRRNDYLNKILFHCYFQVHFHRQWCQFFYLKIFLSNLNTKKKINILIAQPYIVVNLPHQSLLFFVLVHSVSKLNYVLQIYVWCNCRPSGTAKYHINSNSQSSHSEYIQSSIGWMDLYFVQRIYFYEFGFVRRLMNFKCNTLFAMGRHFWFKDFPFFFNFCFSRDFGLWNSRP